MGIIGYGYVSATNNRKKKLIDGETKTRTQIWVGWCQGLGEDDKCCCGYGQWQRVLAVVTLLQFDATLVWRMERTRHGS